jgi:hypothetical protein
MRICAQDCRDFAAEMDQMAGRTTDPESRRRMMDIARIWRELAVQMDGIPAAGTD